ncbi:TerC family protein [Stigmatella erecta]|uniref:Tellurite resistance protein TerC n=1 Tax=Stigmatella erecta TaxID=83460 RepID=A0A1I0JZH0_9BACT|nr:TerC family protein [Stigmatella erecta]SEU16248.1 tellurite resistance protein TerC [Stigmatella erecta]
MNTQVALWVGFNLFVVAMLAIDLGLFHRKDHAVSPKEAGIWTAVWISISLLFCAGIWYFSGPTPALQWFTAYVVEYSLSVDNLFVFLMVFSYFRVAAEHQHRVLFWGIVGAFIMRAVLIIAGAALVSRFHWIIYVFGAFLVFTAVKMLVSKDEEVDPEQKWIVKMARRTLPVAHLGEGSRFFVMEHGRRKVTPLFVVLLVVEATDLLFALDSIPAVLGISQDAFIIYTSNVCAILGLRSLFFVVASLMDKFHFLKVGLSGILGFVGVKMLVTYFDFHVPIGISLGVIAGILVASIVASLIWPKAPDPGHDRESAKT